MLYLSISPEAAIFTSRMIRNVMEDTMLSGVYSLQKQDRRLLKWSFKAKVMRSLKRYISELGR